MALVAGPSSGQPAARADPEDGGCGVQGNMEWSGIEENLVRVRPAGAPPRSLHLPWPPVPGPLVARSFEDGR